MDIDYAKKPRRRVFAGQSVRALRLRLRLNQREMALRTGISISYLSQIESDDRPITDSVLVALSRAFPLDWAEIQSDEEAELLAGSAAAFSDPSIAGPDLTLEALGAAVRRQPAVARRLVAVHGAYVRAQEQLRTLDEALDRGAEGRLSLPWDEVRDWFHDQGNYLDSIDCAAEALALASSSSDQMWLEQLLGERHGVAVERALTGVNTVLRQFDPSARRLILDQSLPLSSQRFLLAHQLMRLELAPVIDEVVETAEFRSAESRHLLSVGLSNYAAGAFLMPYRQFRDAARDLRHDVDALSNRFSVSFEQVCHRLSTLQRPGLAGLPVFFCRVDLAGNITKRHSATRLQFARFGGACPLWIVHEAVAIPDRIWTQLAETPDGTRYVSMAKGLIKPSGSYSRPSRRYAVALGCEADHAGDFIYADSLDIFGRASATPIGTSCRICPRENCEQRAFPPVGKEIKVDPNRRRVVPYSIG